MKQRSVGRQPLAVLSSLRLAVVTMVTLGSVCAFATFYEMRNGTPAVQRDIYQTPWFAFLLALLGTNVVAVMASRYPWTRHHIGFLTAHVGILTILLGSVLSLFGGLDSNMPLYEGETADRVMLLQKALQVTAPGGARGSFPVVFEKHPPGPGHEKRFSVPGSDVVLVADDYQPHVSMQESYGLPRRAPRRCTSSSRRRWRRRTPGSCRTTPRAAISTSAWSPSASTPRASEGEAQRLLAQGEGPNHLSLVLGPGGSLRYVAADGQGTRQTGTVETGKAIATGWPALGVSVDRLFPSATLVRSVVPEKPPAKEERRRAAVRVRSRARPAAASPNGCSGASNAASASATSTSASATSRPSRLLPFRVTLHPLQQRVVPGLAHGGDLRKHGAHRRPRAGQLRDAHLDEPPAPSPRLHLLPVFLRRRAADDVDLLGRPRAGPAARLPRRRRSSPSE